MEIEEFLRWEMAQKDYHELWSGEVRPRPPSSIRHARLTTDLIVIGGNALRNGPYQGFTPLLMVIVQESGSVFHPDGAIACDPHWHSREIGAIDNPTVLFEVTTPESEARDRGEKLRHYGLLSSLRHFVLVSTEARRVEVFSRLEGIDWQREVYVGDASAPLPAVGITLPLGELYRDTDFSD